MCSDDFVENVFWKLKVQCDVNLHPLNHSVDNKVYGITSTKILSHYFCNVVTDTAH